MVAAASGFPGIGAELFPGGPGARGRRGRGIRQSAAGAGRLHLVEVLLPEFVPILSQTIKIVPGVQPGIVTVAENQPHRVIAHRLDRGDLDLGLAGLQHLLARTMPAHFGRGGIHPEQFTGQAEDLAVVETDLEDAGFLVQFDFGGMGHPECGSCVDELVWKNSLRSAAADKAAMIAARTAAAQAEPLPAALQTVMNL
jgi:hypothetical protein